MKTVKVRIALAINSEGDWTANGWADMEDWEAAGIDLGDDLATAHYWIEVEVPVPAAWEPETLAGNAVEAEPEAA